MKMKGIIIKTKQKQNKNHRGNKNKEQSYPKHIGNVSTPLKAQGIVIGSRITLHDPNSM